MTVMPIQQGRCNPWETQARSVACVVVGSDEWSLLNGQWGGEGCQSREKLGRPDGVPHQQPPPALRRIHMLTHTTGTHYQVAVCNQLIVYLVLKYAVHKLYALYVARSILPYSQGTCQNLAKIVPSYDTSSDQGTLTDILPVTEGCPTSLCMS